MEQDPYEVLGVSRDADDEEIRRAYRRLAKEGHPDAGGADDEYFCRLNDAYEAIRTEERRRELDRERARQQRHRRAGPGPPVRPGSEAAAGFRPGPRPHGGGSLFDRLFGAEERGFSGLGGLGGAFRSGEPLGGSRSDSLFDMIDRMFGSTSASTFGSRFASTFGEESGSGVHYRSEVRLSSEQAARGVAVDLELPDGNRRIEVPAGVRHGEELTYSEPQPSGGEIVLDLTVYVDR